jgi:hypothetical protein
MVSLLKYPTEDDWMMVKRCALVTVGKAPVKAPDFAWKQSILKAGHSPIRELQFVFYLENIPYWVSVHLCRHHVGCQPYVKSQRNDRQNEYDRNKAPQDAPVNMIWSMNADALINIAHKRLCQKAAEETRNVIIDMCALVIDKLPEFGCVLVPACNYDNNNCKEMIPCGCYWREM